MRGARRGSVQEHAGPAAAGVGGIALPAIGLVIEMGVGRNRYRSTARRCFAETPLAIPIGPGIGEIGVLGELDGVTALAERPIAPLAIPTVARIREVTIGGHLDALAGLTGGAKAPPAFPAAPISRFQAVAMLGHFHRDAGISNRTIPAPAGPSVFTARPAGEIAIRRNSNLHTSCSGQIEAAITFPAAAIEIAEMRIGRELNPNTGAIGFPIAPVAGPSLSIAPRMCIGGSGGGLRGGKQSHSRHQDDGGEKTLGENVQKDFPWSSRTGGTPPKTIRERSEPKHIPLPPLNYDGAPI